METPINTTDTTPESMPEEDTRQTRPESAELRVMVVDDEALARGIVKELLQGHSEVRLVAECENGFEAVKRIGELDPDILFLDIQMPKLDGFEVLELLEARPAVIFVTAFDQYAVKAFEVSAVDYLLKPFSAARFDAALAKAVERVWARRAAKAEGQGRSASPVSAPVSVVEPLDAQALALAARGPEGRYLTRIPVKDGSRVTIIPVAQLDYAEAQDDYVLLKAGGATHLKQQPLSQLEARLDPATFVRIHRSYLLNLERLARLTREPSGTGVARLHDGTELPVSRSGAARLKAILEAR